MVWLAISVLAWGFLHSLFASLKFKDLVRRRFGPWAVRIYRLIYNLFAGLSFALVLAVAVRMPDKTLYSIPFPWFIPLVIGQGLAVIVLVVGFLQNRPMEFLGISQRGSPIEEPKRLTVEGLYRFIRHPLYTAGLVFIWLMPLMTERLLVINLALTVYVVVGAYLEEGKLARKFGQEYVDYAAVTPMFIPFLKGNKPGWDASK
jgi:protein-S-isoprenylcysteine O-methyltransferase Ste14